MSKKKNANQVMQLISKFGRDYQVLNQGRFYPTHLRLNNVDIWPSTGTYKVGNKWHKGNHNNLISYIKLLCGVTDEPKPAEITKITKEKYLQSNENTDNRAILDHIKAQDNKIAILNLRIERIEETLKDNNLL